MKYIRLDTVNRVLSHKSLSCRWAKTTAVDHVSSFKVLSVHKYSSQLSNNRYCATIGLVSQNIAYPGI